MFRHLSVIEKLLTRETKNADYPWLYDHPWFGKMGLLHLLCHRMQEVTEVLLLFARFDVSHTIDIFPVGIKY